MTPRQWILTGTMGALLIAPTALLAQPPSREEMEAEMAAVFAQADADSSGTLTLEEFTTFETLMRQNMAKRHFARIDADSDGTVTLEELQAGGPGPGGRGPGGRPPR